MSSVLSLYIPVISSFTNEGFIKKMFSQHKIGKVMRVDFVHNKTKNRREAFLHFEKWFDTEESKKLQADILDINTKTQFVYTDKKFWPLLVNKNADKKVNNPNYIVLNNSDIKTDAVDRVNKFSNEQIADIILLALSESSCYKKMRN